MQDNLTQDNLIVDDSVVFNLPLAVVLLIPEIRNADLTFSCDSSESARKQI